MQVLVTGAAGYIGSHAVKFLLERDHHVVGVDSLIRGRTGAPRSLRRWLAERKASSTHRFHFARCDLQDEAAITKLIDEHRIEAVLHFAGLTSVAESVEQPLLYYENNVAASLSLIRACDEARRASGGDLATRFVFSSSAAVYGEPAEGLAPLKEDAPRVPLTPYGSSKLVVERALADYAATQERLKRPFACASLRYFNVAGADPDGYLGEDHRPETHLVPRAILAAIEKAPELTVFGVDYPTPDGSAVRDYVHVHDLVAAHELVMRELDAAGFERLFLNIGLGRGYSVREVVAAVDEVVQRPTPHRIGPRRTGDPAALVADPAAFEARFGTPAARRTLREQVADAAAWFRANPDGYADEDNWEARRGDSQDAGPHRESDSARTSDSTA